MSYELKESDVYGLASVLGASTHRKGNELFFKYCPYCSGGGKDKDTFSVNLQNGAFKCFRSSCGAKGHFVKLAKDFNYPLDFGNNNKRREYRSLPQRPIKTTTPAIEYMKSRGISAEITERYKITTHKDNDSVLVFPFYDEANVLKFAKSRKKNFDPNRDKSKEWTTIKETMPILFGMQFCDPQYPLVITEGQIDSLSLAEAGIKNAVSVPTGAMGMTWIENCWDWLQGFNEIIIFGDNEKGKITLVDKISERIAKPIKVVRQEDYYGEKDANAILQRYGADALREAVDNAQELIVNHIKELADVKAVDLNELKGIKTTIKELDRLIGGMYFGQVILLTGKRGKGKSTLMSQIIADTTEQDIKTLAYSGELPDYHFKRWIDLQFAGMENLIEKINSYGDKVYTIPDDIVKRINEWYRGKIYLYDNNSISDDAQEYASLIDTIELAIQRHGIQFVCLDNLMTALDVDLNQDLYRAQSKFLKRLKTIAVKYGVVILLVAHPKKTKEELLTEDIAGSGDIANRVDVILSYERIENPGEYDAQAKLKVLKNRLTGKVTNEKGIDMYYSEATKRITTATSDEKCYGWQFKPDEFTVISIEDGDLPF